MGECQGRTRLVPTDVINFAIILLYMEFAKLHILFVLYAYFCVLSQVIIYRSENIKILGNECLE